MDCIPGRKGQGEEVSIQWSPKQGQVFDAIFTGPPNVVVPGPVQSGKSLSTMYAFLLWSLAFEGEDFLICSRTRKQIIGAPLKYTRNFADWTNRKLVRREDWYEMPSLRGGRNRYFFLVGGAKGTEEKARSFSAKGALLDEATLLDDEFINTVVDRCSRPDPKIVLAMNPAGPAHPIYTEWILQADEDPDIEHIPFQLSDNPTLTPAYIASLERRYTGPMKQRMVYGVWAATGGAVFPDIHQAIGTPPPLGGVHRWTLGVDHADSSVTHAVLVGHFPDGVQWAVDEWRWDGREAGPLGRLAQARKIKRWLGAKRVSQISVDPNALGMRQALQLEVRVPVRKANNKVVDGIQYLQKAMEEGRLMVSHRCVHLVKELQNYRWDETYGALGEDKPIKENDHGVDALRYDQWTSARGRPKVRVLRR